MLPEVITGLSLLLLFVALERLIGWPAGRGAGTVTIAHASVSVAYVAVVVRSRLADAGTMLEEAAADLYAPPWRVFSSVTLPLLAPALFSGWLLAFTLSLDDVVVASFTSGPGASTLPIVVFSLTRLGTTPEIYAPGDGDRRRRWRAAACCHVVGAQGAFALTARECPWRRASSAAEADQPRTAALACSFGLPRPIGLD